jgi:hypothetical protein
MDGGTIIPRKSALAAGSVADVADSPNGQRLSIHAVLTTHHHWRYHIDRSRHGGM